MTMQIGKRYKYITQGDPDIPFGTKVEIKSMEVRGIGVPYVYAVKVGSKNKQEYVILASELEACK